jgi:Tfp pilus assembly protein PilX
MLRLHRDERGQSLVIVLSLITILFLLGSSLAVHASVALRSTRTSAGQGNDFYAADAATELGIWWQRNGMAGNPPAQTINGITTSTTITTAGGGGGCPAAPTPFWISGFESGVLQSGTVNLQGGFSATTPGQVSVVSNPVRTGSYSLQLTESASANAGGNILPSAGNWPPLLVGRFSVRIDVLPSASRVVAYFFATTEGANYRMLSVYYNQGTGKWALGFGTSGSPFVVHQDSSVTAVAGTWHSFDVRVRVNTNPRTADWYVDGVSQPTLSATDTAASTGFTNFGVGALSTGIAWTGWWDDLEYSQASADFPLGEVRIAPLLPNGMGTNNDATKFQNNDSTAINATTWQRLDEIPMTATTEYVKQIGFSTGAEYVEVAFADTTETCIRGANIVAALHAAGTSSNNSATNHIFNGINVTWWCCDASETSLRYVQKVVSTNSTSPGVGPWTQAAINGIVARFGMSTDTNPNPYVDAFLLEVAYKPSTGPATVTIVGTGGGSTVSTSYTDAGAGVPSLTTWTTTK